MFDRTMNISLPLVLLAVCATVFYKKQVACLFIAFAKTLYLFLFILSKYAFFSKNR